MFNKIKTVDELLALIANKVDGYDKMVEDFNENLRADAKKGHAVNSQHWLAWNAVALLGAATEAKEAQGILEKLDSIKERVGNEDADVLEVVREEALYRLTIIKPKVSSRSTGVAANLAEDYERAFWTEMLGLLTPHRY